MLAGFIFFRVKDFFFTNPKIGKKNKTIMWMIKIMACKQQEFF